MDLVTICDRGPKAERNWAPIRTNPHIFNKNINMRTLHKTGKAVS